MNQITRHRKDKNVVKSVYLHTDRTDLNDNKNNDGRRAGDEDDDNGNNEMMKVKVIINIQSEKIQRLTRPAHRLLILSLMDYKKNSERLTKIVTTFLRERERDRQSDGMRRGLR